MSVISFLRDDSQATIIILAGRPASPRASTERLNINSFENRNPLAGCFSLRTSRHDWSVPDQSKRYVNPTNRKAPSDGPASRTPRLDWSVPDQSERFVSPTNRKAPFDGSEELRVPIGRFPTNRNAPCKKTDTHTDTNSQTQTTNRNATLARPIGRLLL